MRYTLVLRNGNIVDGTGNSAFNGDIAFQRERIAAIGPFVPGNGEIEFDVEGSLVCPGFIDMHTHADFGILEFPGADNYIHQGVSTVVTGNCGFSMAPVSIQNKEFLKEYCSPFMPPKSTLEWSWSGFGEFNKLVKAQSPALNIAPLVGHGSLRIAVCGFKPDPLGSQEMNKMFSLLREALSDGAFGMSTGLYYPPGSYADTDELIQLGSLLAETNTIYTTHLRSEGMHLCEAVEEALKIGRQSGASIQLSHHKSAPQPYWGKVHESLSKMDKAVEEGLDVHCDVYPFMAGSTTITALLPPWALEGGIPALRDRLRSPEIRRLLLEEIGEGKMEGDNGIFDAGWKNIMIAECSTCKKYENTFLSDIVGDSVDVGSVEAFFNWLLKIDGNAKMITFTMDPDDVRAVLLNPRSMIGSDSWIGWHGMPGKPHPRSFATYSRLLGYFVRKTNTLTLEEAIRKATSLPARKLGIPDRGLLSRGYYADVLVLDEENFILEGSYTEPDTYPIGVKKLFVNGSVIIDNDKITGNRPGKVLVKKEAANR